MRKVVHILLSLLLLISTIGVSVSKHYCMGRLKAQWIGQDHKEICGGMEGMPGMEGCCSNESQTFVLDEDFGSTSFDFSINPEFVFLYSTFESDLLLTVVDPSQNLLVPHNNGPPFVEPEIFIRVQSFLL